LLREVPSTRLAYSEALDDETRRYRPQTALSNHPPDTRRINVSGQCT
jgi:hypothetical protein